MIVCCNAQFPPRWGRILNKIPELGWILPTFLLGQPLSIRTEAKNCSFVGNFRLKESILQKVILAKQIDFVYTVFTCGTKWEKVERRNVSGVPALMDGVEQMFMGQYQHNLDSKGRLTVPVRYRELLIDGAYITQGFDRNLMVWTVPAFIKISQRVSDGSITDPTTRLLQRLIFSRGERVDVDGAGRILIPQFLRDITSLDSTATIVGVGSYFEIWSPDLWNNQLAILQDVEANSERFKAFDISPG